MLGLERDDQGADSNKAYNNCLPGTWINGIPVFALFSDADVALEPLLPQSLAQPARSSTSFPVDFATRHRRFEDLLHETLYPATFFDELTEPERFGPIVPVASLRKVMSNTSACTDEQVAEAIWNAEVHWPLLSLALRPDPEEINSGVVNVTVATPARMHRRLHPAGPSKMIDYTMYIDTETEQDSQLQQRLRQLRRDFPSDAVNSTSYFFLRNKPITVSIETKKNKGFEEAVLQIGLWQAAYWAYLDRVSQRRNTDLDGLEFLPGLIVSGETGIS
ncbi:hypothetical protein EsH8_XIII_000027 [Colletotrichum jinshuiense]